MYARVRGLWRSWPLLLWRMIHLGLKATWRAETTHNWPLYNLWLNIKSKSIQNRTHEIHKIITPVLVWVKLAHPTYIFSRVLRDSTPRYVGPSVGRLVGLSVPFLLFRRFWAFWAHSSCPDDPVTFSSTAPAHPHATRVAVYPALFLSFSLPPLHPAFTTFFLQRLAAFIFQTKMTNNTAPVWLSLDHMLRTCKCTKEFLIHLLANKEHN